MQHPQEKRRYSILKKRRSRSLSPKSPQRDQAARRASRRISFSGKHNVREFFTNENTAIVWGETYDVSTEKHVLSNEQLTLQSTHSSSISTTLHSTRNESAAMDISNVISKTETIENKKTDQGNIRPSILCSSETYSEDQKENILVTNDTDMESPHMIQQSLNPSEQLFRLPSTRLSASMQSIKPSMFNFVRKTDTKEKVNCSDNMDISGIEPNDEAPQKKTGNQYRNFLKEKNFLIKSKNEADNCRKTVNQIIDMEFEPNQTNTIIPPTIEINNKQQKVNSLKTINEPNILPPNALQTNNRSSQRETINHHVDMQLAESPKQDNILPNQSRKRVSIYDSSEMSIENRDKSDMSIELIPSEVKCQSMNRQQTTHRVQDITFSPTIEMNPRHLTDHKIKDMSFDTIQLNANFPSIQSGNVAWKKSTSNRMTINELKDMSFDSTTKTSAHTYSAHTSNNKTILGDVTMDLQYVQPYKQPEQSRKSIICKSPSKNRTKVFDQSESFELTKGIEQNSMYLSYHPIHSTKLGDMDCSKFTEIDFECSIQMDKFVNNTNQSSSDIEETFIEDKKQEFQLRVQPKQVKMFSNTKHEACDLDISEDSPIPTAKKFNLNKTPFYFENNPAAAVSMRGSDLSSLDLTNHSKEHQLEKPISNGLDETNTQPIEISDSSVEYITEPVNTTIDDIDRRKINFQEVPCCLQVFEPIEKNHVNNFMTQSIIQITPMKIDDSFEEKPLKRTTENRRLTIIGNESIVIDDTSYGHKSQTSAIEESKLTFIEDDENEDDQICNTKLDLAVSLESSEIDDFIERKCASLATNKSYNMSRLSFQSEISLASIQNEKIYTLNETKEVHPIESIPKLSDILKINELSAFKKSNRMRHSNIFEANALSNEKQNESTQDEISIKNFTNTQAATDATPVIASMTEPTRYSTESNTSSNETSYLTKSKADKQLNEVKLNFSGYEKLIGLATIQDIVDSFCNRMDQINLKAKRQEEQRRKYEYGEAAIVDILDNNNTPNDEELASQNVEAPSWSFLFMNKLKWEDEQQKAELDRQWEDLSVIPYLPAIPDINVLTLNKCRTLKNWTFDDIWFFQGNIHLRNNSMPVFKVCLIYDPNTAERNIETSGAIKFSKINRQFCPIHMKERDYPVFRLEVQELKSKLPSNLLPLCETSFHLSDFDEKLNEYCTKVQHKINEIQEMCRKTHALIKEENGKIYIIKTMLDFEGHNYQDYIIKLNDIDSTEWRNVQTNPQRVLNEEIKTLPKGIPFIKELLINDSRYIPLK